ncbi:Adenylate cyclase, partial [Tetrabaena socialis]
MQGAMLMADWPEGFLEHELTEEVWEEGVLVKRGLRLRIGIDWGPVAVRLVPRTGRLDYVGRPMNRAARIAARAKAAT